MSPINNSSQPTPHTIQWKPAGGTDHTQEVARGYLLQQPTPDSQSANHRLYNEADVTHETVKERTFTASPKFPILARLVSLIRNFFKSLFPPRSEEQTPKPPEPKQDTPVRPPRTVTFTPKTRLSDTQREDQIRNEAEERMRAATQKAIARRRGGGFDEVTQRTHTVGRERLPQGDFISKARSRSNRS